MALNNSERIGRSLESLRVGLSPFFIREVRTKFKDEECVFGYGDKKDYGLKVSSNFNAGDDFKYGRHGCRNGSKLCLDTTTNDTTKMPVTGNDDQRWFADCQGKIAADWPSIYGVRAFNQGLPNAARRTQVSIWLKSPIVDDLFASQ